MLEQLPTIKNKKQFKKYLDFILRRKKRKCLMGLSKGMKDSISMNR